MRRNQFKDLLSTWPTCRVLHLGQWWGSMSRCFVLSHQKLCLFFTDARCAWHWAAGLTWFNCIGIGLTVSVYCLLYRFNCISLHAHDRRSYVAQVLLWPSLLFVRDLILQWLVPHLWHQCLNPTTRTSSIWCQRMTSFKHLGIQSYLWETV